MKSLAHRLKMNYPTTSYKELTRLRLKIYGMVRISMGLSLCNGIPNFMLETMAMWAFPIESTMSCR